MTTIHKAPTDWAVPPNFVDYGATRSAFDWSDQPNLCEGMGPGLYNMAYAAVDRHAIGANATRTALRFVARSSWDGVIATRDLTYAELGSLARSFTNVLRALAIGDEDRLFLLMDRTPELYIAMLGALRNGTVVCPLFSAFGPEPITTRINAGRATVLVTTKSIYRRKIAPIRKRLPSLRHVLVVNDRVERTYEPGTMDFWRWMDAADDVAPIHPTVDEDPALLHFTSGTTGAPKGAVHVHGAAAMHYMTGLYALDLHQHDVFWCTADPGWVTGTSYGVIAPLVHGITSVVDSGEFDAERWYRILQSQQVSVWYTAPTAIRMLIRAGEDTAAQFEFPRLRFVASVGEPLNAEAVWWGERVLGRPIHDNWWQTETGGIMIANTPAFDIKPGSMGRPLPGVDAFVVAHDEQGHVHIVDEPGAEGELALRPGWPSMFRGYLNDDVRYRKCFSDNLYLTGDLVRRDADGYYWFVARADDVIKSAGHLIGPFEVENALTDHPAVAEAAVIGVPEPTVGEMVKAFVTLKAGVAPTDELRTALMAHARGQLGAALAPKEIQIVDSLPHTRSGKILRRLLRARELGLPTGDVSTVEPDPHAGEATQ